MGLVHDKNMFIVNAKLKPRCLTLHEIIIICLLCILKRENVSQGHRCPHLADIGEHPLLLKSLMGEIFGTALQKFASED